jgi:hypothetical protein
VLWHDNRILGYVKEFRGGDEMWIRGMKNGLILAPLEVNRSRIGKEILFLTAYLNSLHNTDHVTSNGVGQPLTDKYPLGRVG